MCCRPHPRYSKYCNNIFGHPRSLTLLTTRLSEARVAPPGTGADVAAPSQPPALSVGAGVPSLAPGEFSIPVLQIHDRLNAKSRRHGLGGVDVAALFPRREDCPRRGAGSVGGLHKYHSCLIIPSVHCTTTGSLGTYHESLGRSSFNIHSCVHFY